MNSFYPRHGGSRKIIDLKNDEALEPFSSKEIQAIFKVSHQTIAERKGVLGLSRKPVGWTELNDLFLLHIFVSSKYPFHTYYQFQSLYVHCLKNNLSIELEVFEKMLMLDIQKEKQEFKDHVIQRIRKLRKQNNATGTYRVISTESEVSNQDRADKTS